MNAKQRSELRKAAELIATKKAYYTCSALKHVGSKLDISKDKTCRMFKPIYYDAIWWGHDTMGVWSWSDEARNARLLGIAFMLTMPEDMAEQTEE